MITYRLSDKATAFTTTRTCGRDKDLLCPAVGVPSERFARPHQVHGIVVRQIAEEFFSLPEDIRTMLLDGVDAVIYDVRDACIGISTADCIPVLCYDPEHHCAGGGGPQTPCAPVREPLASVLRPVQSARERAAGDRVHAREPRRALVSAPWPSGAQR